MKTIKIENDLHKQLLKIKAEKNFKTISDTIKYVLLWADFRDYQEGVKTIDWLKEINK